MKTAPFPRQPACDHLPTCIGCNNLRSFAPRFPNCYTVTMEIVVQQTPNPNALKFVLPAKRFTESANFPDVDSAAGHPLARQLFDLGGIYNVFWAQNFVTVNKYPDVEWEPLTERIQAVLNAISQDA